MTDPPTVEKIADRFKKLQRDYEANLAKEKLSKGTIE
jgi:hypothetical protein